MLKYKPGGWAAGGGSSGGACSRTARAAPAADAGERIAGTIDGPFAIDGDMSHVGEIEEGAGVHSLDAFPARFDQRIVGLNSRSLENAILLNAQIDAGFEEERAAEKSALGNNQHPAAGAGDVVDGGLNGFGVDRLAIADCAEFEDGGRSGGRLRRGGHLARSQQDQGQWNNGFAVAHG